MDKIAFNSNNQKKKEFDKEIIHEMYLNLDSVFRMIPF